MKQLERVYLLNVILYIPTLETIDKEPTDYSKAKDIINTVIQTPLEKQILSYFYYGATVNNIAEFLGISTDKVYKRRRKFKDRLLKMALWDPSVPLYITSESRY